MRPIVLGTPLVLFSICILYVIICLNTIDVDENIMSLEETFIFPLNCFAIIQIQLQTLMLSMMKPLHEVWHSGWPREWQLWHIMMMLRCGLLSIQDLVQRDHSGLETVLLIGVEEEVKAAPRQVKLDGMAERLSSVPMIIMIIGF